MIRSRDNYIDFYYNCMLPELASRRHTSGQSVREKVNIDDSSSINIFINKINVK